MFDIAKKYRIPLVIAINKIDRKGADPEQIMIDLHNMGVNTKQLGGNIPCIPISAKEKTNLDLLSEELLNVSK